MSILKTELKKEERARDIKAMKHASMFLQALARGHVPGHRPDGKPTSGELMLAVRPVARLASVLQVRRTISSPMTLAVWARNN
jgi:hypothetical protein